MFANSPLLRPLGIAAGVLGSFQAVTWGILSLLGILVYTEIIKEQLSPTASNLFQIVLLNTYFVPTATDSNTTTTNIITLQVNSTRNVMTPETVVVWTSIYFGTSVIWLLISGLLFLDSYESKFTSKIIIGWVAVSAVVAAIDLAGTVAFGVDYGRLKSEFDPLFANFLVSEGTVLLLAPIFMMIMCARGFILWIMNVGLVIYLGLAARKLCKKGSPNLLQGPEKSSRRPSFNSHYYDAMGANMYSSPGADFPSQGRQNTTFQPDPISAWDTRSPTVGNQQPSQRDLPPKNSPHINDVLNPITPIPRIGKPVSTPGSLVPTPQPDYSPIMGRPARHKPYLYDAPTRSVLKNSNAQGRTHF